MPFLFSYFLVWIPNVSKTGSQRTPFQILEMLRNASAAPVRLFIDLASAFEFHEVYIFREFYTVLECRVSEVFSKVGKSWLPSRFHFGSVCVNLNIPFPDLVFCM